MGEIVEKNVVAKRRVGRFGCFFSVLSAVALIGLALGLSYFVWYSNARGALDAEIARIEARGEPLWFKDLAPKEPDSDEDGTTLYLQALAKIQAPSQAFTNLVFADPQKPPSQDPLVLAELARNREVLDLLAECIRKPKFRLPIDYNTTQPFNVRLDAVQSARDLARLLAGDVSVALTAGEHDRAVETVGRMFDLSELLRDEPFIISQLVRTAIAANAQASLKQVLASAELTAEQFSELDARLARMEAEFTLVPAMLAERASTFTTLSYLDENIAVLSDPDNGPPAGLRFWVNGPIYPNRMADQAYILGIMREAVDAIDKPGREGSDAIQEIESRVQNAPKSYVFSRMLLPAIVNVRQAGLRHREKLITARLGMRVDRYFAEHGEFPQSLDVLVDEKLTTVPTDLYIGKPHLYRLLPDGFVIYSVGPNGIDEGGAQTPDPLEFYSSFELHYPELASEPDQG
jgi:hypothetical protein